MKSLSSMVDTADEVSAELCQTGSKCDEAELLSGRHSMSIEDCCSVGVDENPLISSAVICATALLEHAGASFTFATKKQNRTL